MIRRIALLNIQLGFDEREKLKQLHGCGLITIAVHVHLGHQVQEQSDALSSSAIYTW